MKIVEISRFGGPEVLTVAERPRPVPGPGEVLIRVVAAFVNRPDVVQRYGKYPHIGKSVLTAAHWTSEGE